MKIIVNEKCLSTLQVILFGLNIEPLKAERFHVLLNSNLRTNVNRISEFLYACWWIVMID